jgi:hypothetical protein
MPKLLELSPNYFPHHAHLGRASRQARYRAFGLARAGLPTRPTGPTANLPSGGALPGGKSLLHYDLQRHRPRGRDSSPGLRGLTMERMLGEKKTGGRECCREKTGGEECLEKNMLFDILRRAVDDTIKFHDILLLVF